jgi:serpin B
LRHGDVKNPPAASKVRPDNKGKTPAARGSRDDPAMKRKLVRALGPLSILACAVLATIILVSPGADATKATPPLPPLPKSRPLTPTEGFALDLLGTQRAGNVVISPDSVAAALAMAGTGARGDTAIQIARTLGLGSPRGFDSIGKLQAELPTSNLAVANGLFVQQGLPLRPPFVAGLERHFAAAPEAVDFAGDPNAALQAINAWGSEHTGGVIPRMLSELPPEARLVLTNAVYLKALWSHEFEPEPFTERFHLEDGKAPEVEAMYQLNRFRYGAGPGYKAVELPYRGSSLSFLAVLPVDSDVGTLEGRLRDSGGLASVVDGLSKKMVKLTLPRFHLRTEVGLDGPLAKLGMTAPFSESADFSGITAAEGLAIGAIQHIADIKVDQKGTEGAATTGIVVVPTSGPAEPLHSVTFDADRPFLFFVRDEKSGAILFAGRLADPRGAEPEAG